MSDHHVPRNVTVVHGCTVGPLAADPSARRVYWRLRDLRALGLTVTFVPVEPSLEGSDPASLSRAGVDVDRGAREPVRRRLERVVPRSELVWLTDLALPMAALEPVLAAVAAGAALVVDLDRVPSSERVAARNSLPAHSIDGLDTEIAHLRERERTVVGASSVLLAESESVARDLEAFDAGPVHLVPASRPVGASGSPRTNRLVVPARFSSEFATPDESALERLLDEPLPVGDGVVHVAAEDAVPRLRRLGRRTEVVLHELHDSVRLLQGALVVADLRDHGAATSSRRAELLASGVPFVASPAAWGDDLPGDVASLVVQPDHPTQMAHIERLAGDADLRARVSDHLVRAAEDRYHPERIRRALAGLLSLPASTATVDLPDLADPGYEVAPTDGTLAACDPRVEQLESEMVPLRLHTRESSIGLQSTMDADQRYRVFARTHLDAPPGSAPPSTPGSTAIRFSVLVPCWNSDPGLLDECISSVAAQQHENWQLCLVDDGSTLPDHQPVLDRWEEADPRVVVRRNRWNQGIAGASNDALHLADGEWVVLLDHDDVLRPDALAWVAAYIDRCPEYDVWYSDEDKLDLSGKQVMPFFKPDWSPDLLLGVNYVCHLLAARRTLVDEVGGFRAGFDGAQDYDLILRLTERATRVGHISKVLYSWRMVEGSTSLDTGAKPKAHDAGHRALEEALARRFEPASVTDGAAHTTHVVRRTVDMNQLVTVVVPTRDRVDLLRTCVDTLRRTSTGVRYELLVVDNQSSDPATLEYLDDLVAAGHQVVRYPHEFSFARQINLAAWHARGDLMLVLNNDARALRGDWLVRLMEHAQRPEVGLVGARLMFPEGQRDGRPQHEGIVMGMAGLAYNIDLGGYMGLDQFARNCSSVTAACVMLRPSVILGVGGMDERLRVAYNDVDFGLRVSEKGLRVVYTPHAVLEHPESASRKDLHPAEDEEWLIGRWGSKGAVREPFVSPHFEWLMPVFYRL